MPSRKPLPRKVDSVVKKVDKNRLKKIAWFLVKFNLLAIPMYLILYFNISFYPLQRFLSLMLEKTLNAMGHVAVSDGDILLIEGFPSPVNISWDCTGWKSMWALTALVLATPRQNQRGKAKFLSLSLPLLFLLNFVRILTTILLSFKFGFQYLDIIHTFIWREGLIMAVIAAWYLWLKWKI